jgi:MFS family permease
MDASVRSREPVVLWFLMFLATFSISMIGSPMAFLIWNYAVTEEATAIAMGIAMSLGPAALTIGYFIGGFLADSVGRKKVTFISFIILSSGLALFIIAPNLLVTYLAYFAANLANGLFGPIFMSLVAGYSKQSSRGTAYGIFNLSWALAQIPAPFLGGLIFESWSVQMPFFIATSISAIALLLSLGMRSPDKVAKKLDSAALATESRDRVKPLMSVRDVIILFGAWALFNGLGNGVIAPLLNIYPMYVLCVTAAELGLSVSLGFAAVTALVQIPGGKLADSVGRKSLTIFGFLVVPFMVCIGLTQTLWQYILVLGGICALGNLTGPAYNAWMMDLLSPEKRSKASGINGFIGNFGRMFGPPIGSFMWNLTFASNPGTANILIPFAVAAFFFGVPLIPVLMIKETRIRTEQAI